MSSARRAASHGAKVALIEGTPNLVRVLWSCIFEPWYEHRRLVLSLVFCCWFRCWLVWERRGGGACCH